MDNRNKVIAFSLAITLFAMHGAEAAAKTSITVKKAGRSTTQTPNTILSGNGVPAKSIGINGDFYIDIKNADLYGPKTNGAWKVATSLRAIASKNKVAPIPGSTGAVGATGVAGAKGATGSTGAVGATGERGAVGATGERGLIGATGERGLIGATGNAGAKGDTGLTGTAGTNGVQGSNGLPGAKGDTGIAGAAGVAGANGIAGAVGATGATGLAGTTGSTGSVGATGAAGISNAKFIPITFTGNLAGSAGSTKASDSFGTFAAGKSYIVRLLVNTYDANSSVFTYGLGMSITASGDNPVISSSYSVAYGSIYSGGNRSTVSVIADLVLNGFSTTSPYSLIVTLTSGANGAASIFASGVSTQLLVGAIS